MRQVVHNRRDVDPFVYRDSSGNLKNVFDNLYGVGNVVPVYIKCGLRKLVLHLTVNVGAWDIRPNGSQLTEFLDYKEAQGVDRSAAEKSVTTIANYGNPHISMGMNDKGEAIMRTGLATHNAERVQMSTFEFEMIMAYLRTKPLADEVALWCAEQGLDLGEVKRVHHSSYTGYGVGNTWEFYDDYFTELKMGARSSGTIVTVKNSGHLYHYAFQKCFVEGHIEIDVSNRNVSWSPPLGSIPLIMGPDLTGYTDDLSVYLANYNPSDDLYARARSTDWDQGDCKGKGTSGGNDEIGMQYMFEQFFGNSGAIVNLITSELISGVDICGKMEMVEMVFPEPINGSDKRKAILIDASRLSFETHQGSVATGLKGLGVTTGSVDASLDAELTKMETYKKDTFIVSCYNYNIIDSASFEDLDWQNELSNAGKDWKTESLNDDVTWKQAFNRAKGSKNPDLVIIPSGIGLIDDLMMTSDYLEINSVVAGSPQIYQAGVDNVGAYFTYENGEAQPTTEYLTPSEAAHFYMHYRDRIIADDYTAFYEAARIDAVILELRNMRRTSLDKSYPFCLHPFAFLRGAEIPFSDLTNDQRVRALMGLKGIDPGIQRTERLNSVIMQFLGEAYVPDFSDVATLPAPVPSDVLADLPIKDLTSSVTGFEFDWQRFGTHNSPPFYASTRETWPLPKISSVKINHPDHGAISSPMVIVFDTALQEGVICGDGRPTMALTDIGKVSAGGGSNSWSPISGEDRFDSNLYRMYLETNPTACLVLIGETTVDDFVHFMANWPNIYGRDLANSIIAKLDRRLIREIDRHANQAYMADDLYVVKLAGIDFTNVRFAHLAGGDSDVQDLAIAKLREKNMTGIESLPGTTTAERQFAYANANVMLEDLMSRYSITIGGQMHHINVMNTIGYNLASDPLVHNSDPTVVVNQLFFRDYDGMYELSPSIWDNTVTDSTEIGRSIMGDFVRREQNLPKVGDISSYFDYGVGPTAEMTSSYMENSQFSFVPWVDGEDESITAARFAQYEYDLELGTSGNGAQVGLRSLAYFSWRNNTFMYATNNAPANVNAAANFW